MNTYTLRNIKDWNPVPSGVPVIAYGADKRRFDVKVLLTASAVIWVSNSEDMKDAVPALCAPSRGCYQIDGILTGPCYIRVDFPEVDGQCFMFAPKLAAVRNIDPDRVPWTTPPVRSAVDPALRYLELLDRQRQEQFEQQMLSMAEATAAARASVVDPVVADPVDPDPVVADPVDPDPVVSDPVDPNEGGD